LLRAFLKVKFPVKNIAKEDPTFFCFGIHFINIFSFMVPALAIYLNQICGCQFQ